MGTEPPVPSRKTAADLGRFAFVVNRRTPESSVVSLGIRVVLVRAVES